MTVTAGIDIGSTATKALILRNEKIAGFNVRPTGADPEKAAKIVLKRAMKQSKISLKDIDYIVSTGYGRRTPGFSNEAINEINANARGSRWLGSAAGKIKTIIDIGGQDSKVISLDREGIIKDFAMNDKCAAGTGKFLEVIADTLEIDLEQMGKYSLKSENPIEINSTCVVFAQSEVISLIARRKKKTDIIAGIHQSIAERITQMSKRVGIKDVVFFDGGPAKNIGLRKALEEKLGKKVYVPKRPQIINALGAALTASDLAPK